MTEQERNTVFNLRCKWEASIPIGMTDEVLLSLYCDFSRCVELNAGRLNEPQQSHYKRIAEPLFRGWLIRG